MVSSMVNLAIQSGMFVCMIRVRLKVEQAMIVKGESIYLEAWKLTLCLRGDWMPFISF
ncbi:MAG: hypothetical protein JWP37_923 [Mucilaginibacter sp.]|nr:hypothetical protein [Mucilaginibacter sp.]